MCSMTTRVDLAVHGAATVRGAVPALFDGVRAQERSSSYFHLLDKSCDWALPFETRGLPAAALQHLAPESPTRIATAGDGVAAGDMAVQAARAALAQAARDGDAEAAADSIRWLIYCHTTIDEITNGSIACRLSHELQLKQCFPVALSQSQVAGTFIALLLAQSLLAEAAPGDRVMVVAADKWLFPYLRSHGRWGVASDGAGALVLGGMDAPAATRITSVAVASAPEPMWTPIDALTPPQPQTGHAEGLAAQALQAGGLDSAAAPVLTAAAGEDDGEPPALVALIERLRGVEAGAAGVIVLEGVHGDGSACTVCTAPRNDRAPATAARPAHPFLEIA